MLKPAAIQVFIVIWAANGLFAIVLCRKTVLRKAVRGLPAVASAGLLHIGLRRQELPLRSLPLSPTHRPLGSQLVTSSHQLTKTGYL